MHGNNLSQKILTKFFLEFFVKTLRVTRKVAGLMNARDRAALPLNRTEAA